MFDASLKTNGCLYANSFKNCWLVNDCPSMIGILHGPGVTRISSTYVNLKKYFLIFWDNVNTCHQNSINNWQLTILLPKCEVCLIYHFCIISKIQPKLQYQLLEKFFDLETSSYIFCVVCFCCRQYSFNGSKKTNPPN